MNIKKFILLAVSAIIILVVGTLIIVTPNIKKKGSYSEVVVNDDVATMLDATLSDVMITDATTVDAIIENDSDNDNDNVNDVINSIMDKMTTEEKVAQLFFVVCPTYIAVDVQQEYQFGGYLLFDRDFESYTADDVRTIISSYQNVSKVPMLIGVDEEGGTVCRVSNHSQFRDSRFKSPRNVYYEDGLYGIKRDETEKAQLLNSLGINVNFAPVCDISTNPSDFMYDRSLGDTPEMTGEFVKTCIKVSQDNHVGTVLKHFPGYGNNNDTHKGIVYDERDYEIFVNEDFVPFLAGIEKGAGCILMSHNIVVCMDDKYPASISPKVHKILREELGFDGVIITDDMSMSAITRYTDGEDAAVLAIQSGNDMICCSDYETQYAAVLQAVKDGEISEERIEESVTRVLKWKIDIGIIDESGI